MRLSEAYTLLELSSGATLDEIKANYRKLAFKYHPDLHPGDTQAAVRFARLNEAYVLLKKQQEPRRTKSGARVYDAETIRQEEEAKVRSGHGAGSKGKPGAFFTRQEEVLKDILNDPFAKQVFEDIFSKLRRGADLEDKATQSGEATQAPKKKAQGIKGFPQLNVAAGWLDGVKNWAARQLDERQTMYLPPRHLVPGTTVQVQIKHGFQANSQTIELTLPADFNLGQFIRLKGLGRRLGPWRGDLYLRLLAKTSAMA